MAYGNLRDTEPGRKYGRLTVIEWVRDDFTCGGKKRPVFAFMCECGKPVEGRIYSARSGHKNSCGCLRLGHTRRPPGTFKHGHATGGKLTPEFRAWRDMMTRATNPNTKHAMHYVGRGIGVCEEWAYGGDGKGFERFLACVGEKPSPRHSLDRIDVDGDYRPGNVRWATPAEQARNRSDNHLITFRGESMCLTDAAARFNLPTGVLSDRLNKLKWPVERALLAPRRVLKRKGA